MPQPTIELCSFTASQALLDNPSLLHSGYDLLGSKDGPQRLYEGVGVEDDKRRWIIVVWDSYEHHMRMTDNAAYPEAECADGDPKSHHVIFSDDAMMALSAPVTEFGVFQVKDLSKRDEVYHLTHELVEHSRKVSGEICELQHQPFIFGEAREVPGLFYFVAGWESVEDHKAASSNPAGNKPFIAKILPFIDVTMSHARVREYGLRRECP